jgi:hypothetical protein
MLKTLKTEVISGDPTMLPKSFPETERERER